MDQVTCPHCQREIDLKQIKKERRAEASRQNGKKGGRPKKNVTD